MTRGYIFLFFFFCILIYMIFASFSVSEPLMGDSIYFYTSAKVFNNKTFQPTSVEGDHPTLYVHLLAFLDKFGYLNPVSARSMGILSFIITLILIYVIAQNIFKEDKNKSFIGLVSIFLYSINPMVIQGSLLTAIDTTVLVLLLLFFIYLFLTLINKYRLFLLGIIFALLLWAKLTTPFALIPAVFIFHSLSGRFKKGVKESGLIFLGGFFIFIVSWAVYCYFTKRVFQDPFLHTISAFINTSPFSWRMSTGNFVLNIARVLIRLTLYITPFYFLMFLMASWHRLKEFVLRKEIHRIDILLILSLIIYFVYLFTGGCAHSFPTYHYPFLSLASIIIAGFIGSRAEFKKEWLSFCIFTIIVIYNVFLIGDFLYSSDYGIRENLIVKGEIAPAVVKSLIFQLILYLLPFFLVSAILKIRKDKLAFYKTVLIWTIASCFSMDILQAKADYHTVYCYGGKGTEEVISFTRKMRGKEGIILTTHDISYNIDEKDFLTSPDHRFSNVVFCAPERFISVVKDRKPDFIISSISSNTVQQYREVFNNRKIKEFLKEDFMLEKIGSYTIWVRKDVLKNKGNL